MVSWLTSRLKDSQCGCVWDSDRESGVTTEKAGAKGGRSPSLPWKGKDPVDPAVSKASVDCVS